MKRSVVFVLLSVLAVWGISALDLVEDEVLCSVSDIASVLDSEYMPGRVQTAPDAAKEGHAQVINTHSGGSYWARYLMPSHVPSVDELQEGQLILWNESFADPKPSEWAYRHQIWRFGLLTSTKEAFKGVVEVNFTRGYLQWCRLPDVPQQVAFRGGEVLCAYTQEAAMENNTYATAKIQTLPSEVSRDMAEVRYANSAKGWSRYVVPSHQAQAEELKEGGWVLCSENFEKLRTELNYRYGNWYLMRITSLRDLFQEVVEANGISVPLGWVRVPEYTPEELQAIDMEEIVREAKAEEALDWIRQQRMLADWRIRKHTGRLEDKLAAAGSTQMSAEDARKDLEFFAGQTQQAMEIIEDLNEQVLGNIGVATGPKQGAISSQSTTEYLQRGKRTTEKYLDVFVRSFDEAKGLIETVGRTTIETLIEAQNTTSPYKDKLKQAEESLNTISPTIQQTIEGISGSSSTENLNLQDHQQKSARAFLDISNVLKTIHDTSKAAISNLR